MRDKSCQSQEIREEEESKESHVPNGGDISSSLSPMSAFQNDRTQLNWAAVGYIFVTELECFHSAGCVQGLSLPQSETFSLEYTLKDILLQNKAK